MTESLYMDAIDEVLLAVESAKDANISDKMLEFIKQEAVKELIKRFHFDPDDAQAHVAVAAGEEP